MTFIIRTNVDFRKRPRPRLGSVPMAIRQLDYEAQLRDGGYKDEEFHLRQKRGSRLQAELHNRPIPRHRALTVLPS